MCPRSSKGGSSGTLFAAFVPPRAHDLDLHMSQERRQSPQSSQHRSDERHHSSNRHPRCKRYLQEHLVVLVADDQTMDVALRDQLFGPIDEFAAGYLYLLCPGVLFFLAFVTGPVELAAHYNSPWLVVPST